MELLVLGGHRRVQSHLVGELERDGLRDAVGHAEDVHHDLVVDGDIALPVGLQPRRRLLDGLVEVYDHHVVDGLERKVRVGIGQERRDVLRVVVPGGVGRLEPGLVAGLRGGDDIGGAGDVDPQQAGKLVAGIGAVEWLDRGPEIVLVR